MFKYLIFLIFSMNLIGKDFEVKLYYQEEVILGEPCYVTVEIKNISGREIIISSWWKKVKLEVRRADGKKRRQVIPDVQYIMKWPPDGVKVKAGGFLRRTEEIFWQYEDEPGVFLVRYKFISIGKEVELEEGGKKELVRSWAGEIVSDEAKIELKEPVGIDKDAYDYFKGHPLAKPNELLEKYPTSTYAGWALKSYVYKTFDFDEEGRRNEKRKYRDLIESFMNANNDFIFAGSLASKAAFISLELGEVNKACELFALSSKLKWECPTMSEKLKEESIKKSKSTYEKLKKEGKCK